MKSKNIDKHSRRQLMYARMRGEFLKIPKYAEMTKKELRKAIRRHCAGGLHNGPMFDQYVRDAGRWKEWQDFCEDVKAKRAVRVLKKLPPICTREVKAAAKLAAAEAGVSVRKWRDFVPKPIEEEEEDLAA